MLAKELIESSCYQWASPVVLVKTIRHRVLLDEKHLWLSAPSSVVRHPSIHRPRYTPETLPLKEPLKWKRARLVPAQEEDTGNTVTPASQSRGYVPPMFCACSADLGAAQEDTGNTVAPEAIRG